jgi:regulatory protein
LNASDRDPGRRRPDPAGASPPAGTVRGAALRLLGRREYTVAELRSRLVARGYPPDDTDRALETLVAERLADDRRAALAHIRTGSRIKGRGRHRLRRELEARGVDPDLVSDLLAGHSETDELAAATQVLARKRPAGRLSMADRRRLFQHLLRRGFSADLIARVLKASDTPDA